MTQKGLLSISRPTNCLECHHAISDLSHPHCHSHAFCARGGQYHAWVCSLCQELWHTAAHAEDPADAIEAYDVLTRWIRGFRKNSKGRPPGSDHFYDRREKFALQDLHMRILRLQESVPPRAEEVQEVPLHCSPKPSSSSQEHFTPPPREVPPEDFVEEDALSDSSLEEYIPSFSFVPSPSGSAASSPHGAGEFRSDDVYVYF